MTDTKICTGCQVQQPVSAFSINRSSKDGLQWQCKTCLNEKAKGYYQAQRAEKISLAKQRHDATRERLRQAKTGPCVDCKATYDPVCMDFDHLPEFEKYTNIADMIRRHFSWKRIEAEIAKCELVCANCHRLRTRARLDVI